MIEPSSINKKEFSLALKGYNRKEVRDFLETVTSSYKKLWIENQKLTEKVKILQEKLKVYQLKDKDIDNLISIARENANKIVEEGQEKADFIIKQAEIKANRIVEEGKKKFEQIKKEVDKLCSQKKNLITRLKNLLDSQMEILKFYEEETPSSSNNRKTTSFFSLSPLPSSNEFKKIVFEDE